ncbi:MAG: site-specific integrase [Candidatus Humimicrobiaceae bacterium]
MNRRKIPEYLTEEEVKKIIAQPNKRTPTGLRNKAILSFIWDTGSRTGDIINLRPSRIRLKDREADLKDGKYGVDRTVIFSEYTAELLREYKKQRPKSEYLFCTLEGNQLSRRYLYNMVRRYARRAGIDKKVGGHAIRHSYAIKFYKDSGHDLFALQKLLGHSRVTSTQVYCYIDNEHARKAQESYFTKRDHKDTIEDKLRALEEQIQQLRDSR